MTTPTLPPYPTTIANLPLANTPLAGNEFVPISQGGVTKAVAVNGFTIVGPIGPVGPTGATGPQGPPGGAANIATGTINNLAYYITTTSLAGIANLNNGILVTSGGGVPSISTAIPSGVTAQTQSASDTSTRVATTAFVNQGGLTLGTSTATTQAAADSSTKVATTAFVNATALTLASGTTAVTQSGSDNSTKVATTAQVQAAIALLPSGITVGTTAISGGTSGRVLYDNGGVLGELVTTGSSNVVLSTSPTLVTPVLGTPASGNLANCTGYPQQIMAALAVGSLILGGSSSVSTPLVAGTSYAASGLHNWKGSSTGGFTAGDSLSGTWLALGSVPDTGAGTNTMFTIMQRIA